MADSRAATRRGLWSRGRLSRLWLCLPLVLSLAGTTALAAGGESPGVAEILYDAAIDRPLGLVETVVGVGIATVAYPLALGSDRSELVLERCVTSPARYTFTRSLGDFSQHRESLCSPVGLGWGLVRVALGAVERPIGLLFGRSPFSRDRDEKAEELEI